MTKRRVHNETKPEVLDALLECLKEGKSVPAAAREVGMGARTVFDHLERDPDFRERYVRAREVGYELLGEQILEDASTGTGDVLRDRLIVDTKKWYLSKVLAKKYGDRTAIDLKVDGADDLIKSLAAKG